MFISLQNQPATSFKLVYFLVPVANFQARLQFMAALRNGYLIGKISTLLLF